MIYKFKSCPFCQATVNIQQIYNTQFKCLSCRNYKYISYNKELKLFKWHATFIISNMNIHIVKSNVLETLIVLDGKSVLHLKDISLPIDLQNPNNTYNKIMTLITFS